MSPGRVVFWTLVGGGSVALTAFAVKYYLARKSSGTAPVNAGGVVATIGVEKSKEVDGNKVTPIARVAPSNSKDSASTHDDGDATADVGAPVNNVPDHTIVAAVDDCSAATSSGNKFDESAAVQLNGDVSPSQDAVVSVVINVASDPSLCDDNDDDNDDDDSDKNGQRVRTLSNLGSTPPTPPPTPAPPSRGDDDAPASSIDLKYVAVIGEEIQGRLSKVRIRDDDDDEDDDDNDDVNEQNGDVGKLESIAEEAEHFLEAAPGRKAPVVVAAEDTTPRIGAKRLVDRSNTEELRIRVEASVQDSMASSEEFSLLGDVEAPPPLDDAGAQVSADDILRSLEDSTFDKLLTEIPRQNVLEASTLEAFGVDDDIELDDRFYGAVRDAGLRDADFGDDADSFEADSLDAAPDDAVNEPLKPEDEGRFDVRVPIGFRANDDDERTPLAVAAPRGDATAEEESTTSVAGKDDYRKSKGPKKRRERRERRSMDPLDAALVGDDDNDEVKSRKSPKSKTGIPRPV